MSREKNDRKRKIFELTYCSLAAENVDNGILKDILEQAREFNGKNDVTGCLLYHNGEFVQILEGDKEKVINLYNAICKDRRHYNVSILSSGAKNERFFDDWHMAYSEYEDLRKHFTDEKYFEKNLTLLSEMILKPTRTSKIFWAKVRLIMDKSRKSD